MRNLARAIDARQQSAGRTLPLQGGDRLFAGSITVEGIGWITADIPFPVRFIERPHFSYGFALDDNQAFDEDNLPGAERCSVVAWDFGVRAATGARYYEGCTISAVIAGSGADQLGHLSYLFVAPALVGIT